MINERGISLNEIIKLISDFDEISKMSETIEQYFPRV